MKLFYAVKHKTEERYLTGASSAAPRLYTSEGKAKGANGKAGPRNQILAIA